MSPNYKQKSQLRQHYICHYCTKSSSDETYCKKKNHMNGTHFVSSKVTVHPFSPRSGKMRGQTFSLVTVKGDEFTFVSPNSAAITSLVCTFLEGLRKRSKYAVGLQEFIIQGWEYKDKKDNKGAFYFPLENLSTHS